MRLSNPETMIGQVASRVDKGHDSRADRGPQKRGATIIAEYLGGATNCDAYHMTDPRADGLGVSTCIELALKNAQIQKEQVGSRGAKPCTC